MFLFKTLEKLNNRELYKTFVEAFSDYQVKIDLPYWKFQQMLLRRGYYPNISMGCFMNKKLIGFSLSGFRSWNEKKTVSDKIQ